jgi:hypothetical protein
MRRRLGLLFALMLLLGAAAFGEAALARDVVLAEEAGEGEGESDVTSEEGNETTEGGTTTEGDEGEDQESGGQDEPEAETGSGADQTEEAATETGPPWTYQMARIALASLLLLGLAIAGAYYRFVVMRQRGAA